MRVAKTQSQRYQATGVMCTLLSGRVFFSDDRPMKVVPQVKTLVLE